MGRAAISQMSTTSLAAPADRVESPRRQRRMRVRVAIRVSRPGAKFSQRFQGRLAEREGFEPPIRLPVCPHFECGAFNHSATSPRSQGGARRSAARVEAKRDIAERTAAFKHGVAASTEFRGNGVDGPSCLALARGASRRPRPGPSGPPGDTASPAGEAKKGGALRFSLNSRARFHH